MIPPLRVNSVGGKV
jgi:hypothetical protein